MEKFNLRKIMKRAWELFRKLKFTFSMALKASWKMTKKEMDLHEKWGRKEEDGYAVTFNVWEGYGFVRAYYKCNWFSKYANSNKANFINLID